MAVFLGPEPRLDPVSQRAHAVFVEKAKRGRIDVYFTGDSITRRWQATDKTHKHNWDANFFGWNAANFGWGGDTTANVLYRLLDGELAGVHPKVIVLLVGTNDIGNQPPDDPEAMVDGVVRGIRAILDVFREKAPGARVILTAIFPRNDVPGDPTAMMPVIDEVNRRLAKLADAERVRFLNVNHRLADASGRLFDGMTEDGLHLADAGYQVWADGLKPLLHAWLGPPADVDDAPEATGLDTILAEPRR